MQIQLRDLRRHSGQNLDFYETMDLHHSHPNIEEEVSVHVTAHAHFNEDALYVLDGQLNATLQLKCSKCLTVYDWPLSAHWHEVFSLDERPDEEDDSDIHFVNDDEVDLNPYIREALLLEIPFVPVCRDDCQGLCPTCGINRNEASCECNNERIDPRLADLQKFFSAEDKQE